MTAMNFSTAAVTTIKSFLFHSCFDCSSDTMFWTKVSIFFIIILFAKVESKNLVMIGAIEKIVLSNHPHEIRGINLINGLKNYHLHDVKDFINELLTRIGSKISVRFINFKVAIQDRMFFKVLLLDSLESFHEIIKKILPNRYQLRGYFLIVFESADETDMKEIFKTLWESYINNVNILSRGNSNESILVSTIVPFSERGCNKTDPMKFEEFTNGSFINRSSIFFPDKFKNFHNCPIKVTTFEALAPSVLRENYANGSYRLYGRDVDIIHSLASELHFTADIYYLLPYGGWGILSPNGSATGSMGRAIRREADFILGNLYLKLDRSIFMDYSFVYFLDQIIFVIPVGAPLTTFQKLIRPFEIFVWIVLGASILVGIVIIMILQMQSKTVKDFVYGKGIKNPIMNVLIAVFGGSQHVLPSRNFSRSLLMMFLLFCLVIR